MGTVLSTFGRAASDKDYNLTSVSEAALKAIVAGQYHDEISKVLNPIELMPLLIKEQLLDFNERSVILEDNSKSTQYEKSRYILQSLETKGPYAYSKFLCCVKAENNHMGHEYIAALLQEKRFCSKVELEESSRLKQAIQEHYSEMMDISLQSLVPLIYSKKLLTEDEKQKLLSQHNKTRSERIHLLLLLLDTKGPSAHRLFIECLQTDSHPAHKELYEKLICCSDQIAASRKRKRLVDDYALALPRRKLLNRQWELQEPLKGERYNTMMREFQSCNHNGDWERLEREAIKYAKFHFPEYEVVICLERATSWIFRKKPEKVLQLVGKAKQIIETKVHGDNYRILLGRSESTLSRLFRYLEDLEKASEHIAKAKELLYGTEAGEDTARVHYNDACITLECLDKLPIAPTERDFERIVELFERVISDDQSHENGQGYLATYAFLHLAQMYLGSTHYTPGTATDHEKIKSAQNYLNAIRYHDLSQRSKCLYHVIESDLHRSCEQFDKAKASLDLTLSISKQHKFELEISSAQIRLQSLHISQA